MKKEQKIRWKNFNKKENKKVRGIQQKALNEIPLLVQNSVKATRDSRD